MIKRIELKNFMSHEHTVIEPAAGLTVLIGPNNVGKSAIIAALQILCYNENSTYVMRHGTKQCSVSVETDDGHFIGWRRKKSPSYEIDGQKFDRLARNGVPEELHQTLRLSKVEANNGDAFDIHFGSQKSPIFLLDQSGATAARFFASSSDAIRLVAMQQKHKDKVRDARRERIQLDTQAKQLNAELAALEPAVAIERRIESIEADYQQIIETSRQLEALFQAEKRMTQQRATLQIYETEEATLKTLSPPPHLQPTEPLLEIISRLKNYSESVRWESNRISSVSDLIPPPRLEETTHLEKTCSDSISLEQSLISLSELHFILKNLSSPPEIQKTNDLELLVTQINEAERKFETNQQHIESLETLLEPPNLHDLNTAEYLLDNLDRAVAEEEIIFEENKLLAELLPLEISRTDTFEELVEAISEAQQRLQSLQNQLELFDAFSVPEVKESLQPVEDLLSQIELVTCEIKERSEKLKQLNIECDQVAEQIREAALDENCPVCGGPLNAEQLLEQAGRIPG